MKRKYQGALLLAITLGAAPGAIIEPTPPPVEIRLFRSGENSTRKGVFLFDELAIAQVSAASEVWGVEYSIDYDHAMVRGGFFDSMDPAERGKAAGWFKLAIRDGELWAVNIRWTPRAAQAISDGEWLYISPAFHSDEDRRVTDITNMALTNTPATDHPMPLRELSINNDKGNGMLEALLKALGLAANATEAEVLGRVVAMQGTSAQVEQLSLQVKSLLTEKASAEKSKLTADVDAAIADGRVVPSQRDLFLSLGETKPEIVRQFLSTAVKVMHLETPGSAKPAPTPAPGAAVMLSAEDKKVASLLMVSAKDMLATRKMLAEKESE